MLRALLLALFLAASSGAAVAQVNFNVGDEPSPKPAQPVPLNAKEWQNILAPQRCPNGTYAALNTCGDGRDGYHWQWDSFSRHMELRPPKILFGPGAITSTINLTQNTWNNLYGAVGASGYRGGLVAYIPRGNYVGSGQVAIATGSTANTTYTVRVLMGTCNPGSGAQNGILIIPQVPTSAGTTAGNNTLTFSATTCIIPGMVAFDVTNPAAIPAGVTVSSTSPTQAVLSGNVASPGVSSGDVIMFGFVSGYGGPQAWPGAAGLSTTVHFEFTTAAIGCLAADKSDQQCEMLTQIYTNGAGSSVAIAGGQVTNPPYATYFNILRVDGGYGGQ